MTAGLGQLLTDRCGRNCAVLFPVSTLNVGMTAGLGQLLTEQVW